MRLFFLLTLTLPTLLLAAPSNDLIRNAQITQRCQELLILRASKIKLKQRAQTLIDKNLKLLNRTPEKKKSLQKKMNFTLRALNDEKRLLELKIKNLEETIIRQGCPTPGL